MTREVALTHGLVALVDDEDFERVSAWKWRAAQRGPDIRACRSSQNGEAASAIGLGPFILNPPTGLVVDHIDGDPLNNVRANLRACSPAENSQNKRKHCGATAYKGVHPRGGKFAAAIKARGRAWNLGRFDSAEQAARIYDAFARVLHGEFACLNFPDEGGRGALVSPPIRPRIPPRPAPDPNVWNCGHPRTPENTQRLGKSGDHCKQCRRRIARESARRASEAKRAKRAALRQAINTVKGLSGLMFVPPHGYRLISQRAG